MNWWLVVAAGLVALAALLAAAWTDRRNRRRREALLGGPPERPVPGLAGRPAPAYVTLGDAPGPVPLGEARRAELGALVAAAAPLAVGWADDRFRTDPASGWAVVDNPLVLVTEAVTAFRELLPLAAAVRQEPAAGLVVAARSFDAATLEALAANLAHRKLSALAVVSPTPESLAAVAAATAAVVVAPADLRAGYLPRAALGTCQTWVSDAVRSWVLGT
jgi:hypothetical protein